jgi:hypothetical protein
MSDQKKTQRLSPVKTTRLLCPKCGNETIAVKYDSDTGAFYRIRCRCGNMRDYAVDEVEHPEAVSKD